MDQLPEVPLKVGIKIERPTTEKVSFFYIFLLFVSLLCISFTGWLLILEWTGKSLPHFLKLPIS